MTLEIDDGIIFGLVFILVCALVSFCESARHGRAKRRHRAAALQRRVQVLPPAQPKVVATAKELPKGHWADRKISVSGRSSLGNRT